MVIPGVVILPLLLTQVLSAPSGCIESCGSYVKQYQTQSSGSFQNHEGALAQDVTRLRGLDYSRPGTWSEHNDYDINNGHGKVHEEHGQVVEGPKTVRYYKKNYTSSYSTGYSNGERQSGIENQNSNYELGAHVPSTQGAFNSQGTYNQVGNSESIAQQHKYNRIQNQQQTQSSIRRTNAQSERLEDFGEYSGNSQDVQGQSDLNTQTLQEPHHTSGQSGNWSKVDSYNTDGGRGRVFEEEGQFLSGPKKVRYYKRNYTSTYSSSGGIPIPEVDRPGLSDIHSKIENLHREMGKEFNQISTTGNVASTNLVQTNINRYGLASDNTHNINSNTYRSRVNHESSLSSSQHDEEQHFADTPTERLPYRNPSPNSYGTNIFRTYTRHNGRLINHQPIEQVINPNSGYTNVLSSGRSYNAGTTQEQSEHLDRLQSSLVQSQMSADNLDRNRYNQNSAIYSNTPGRVAHYKEHWSSSQTRESSVPEYSRDISQHNEQSAQYNNQQYERQHSSHQALQDHERHMYQSRGDSFNSAHQTNSGKLMTGPLNLGQGEDTVDCAHETSEHVHSRSEYQRKYKRSIKHAELSEMQHPTDIPDLPQQTSEKLELGPDSQQSYQPWVPDADHQHSEDLTQQTGQFDDFTQQTSDDLQFGQLSQHSSQPHRPSTGNQHAQDRTRQTGQFDDFTQQTSDDLQFGQLSHHSSQPRRPSTGNKHSDDLTQQTGQFDDFTQQTSGNLQFGQLSQHSNQPRRPSTGDQHAQDLTQQTGEFDDLTQQTSGTPQFGKLSQHSNQPWRPGTENQHSDDLSQQTGEFDDLTQQTSGNLEFGQQSQHSNQPRRPGTGNQHSDDLTQQTGEFDDLTQQISGNLEFGQLSQHSNQPRRPSTGDQHAQDLTQQTGEFDDLTQQTSGTPQFGKLSQHSNQPWRPGTGNQHSDDLTQQTGEFDDLTQQTSGNLEFGQQSQHSNQPRRPGTGNQHSDDLTQQTGEFDDLTQQTSGNLQFGQQSQHSNQPWRPGTRDQHAQDLTQQTGEFDDFTQQTSDDLQFGQLSHHSNQPRRPSTGNQHAQDLTQQTGEFDDFTQQTSDDLQFGQLSQHSNQPRRPNTGNQHAQDLTQQTGKFDDFTQQTSGNLQFGPLSQHSNQPRRPSTGDQHAQDLTQQTGEFDDLIQQTSGTPQFGKLSQHSNQPRRLGTGNQHSDDLTQQTGEFDDLTQQTSGSFQFGKLSQHSNQPWRPGTRDQHAQDLTQQTGEFDDLSQQTSGNLQFGQLSQHSNEPWRPGTRDQHAQDLTQQTGEFDDFTQQTSGNLQFGQQSQHSHQPWRPGTGDQHSEDLTQQTGEFDDLHQQRAGKLEFGQFNQEDNKDLPTEPHGSTMHVPKPVGKPKPRARYSRIGSMNNVQTENQNTHNTISQQTLYANSRDISVQDIHEIPPIIAPASNTDNIRSQNMRGDQGTGNLEDNSTPKNENQPSESNGFDVVGGNGDQVNLLHKSNDATVGVQWHYTYHPSDERPFVQQPDQDDKEDMQQQSSHSNLSDLEQNLDQQVTQDKYQQWSNQDTEESRLDQLSQKYGSVWESTQQTLGQPEDQQKAVRSSETKHKLEPRILEAYGGGPYDAHHDDDIYNGVTINPSATLRPVNSADAWDVREKGREMTATDEVTPPPLPVEPLANDTDEVTPPPSFWSRIGSKITTTFDKAKEKAKHIFGKK